MHPSFLREGHTTPVGIGCCIRRRSDSHRLHHSSSLYTLPMLQYPSALPML